jgi:hypothetical protein
LTVGEETGTDETTDDVSITFGGTAGNGEIGGTGVDTGTDVTNGIPTEARIPAERPTL